MANQAPRNVSWIISKLRNVLGQREIVNHARFETKCSPRTQTAPVLPGGPSHRLAGNYYYTRDGRRESEPPRIAYVSASKQIAGGEKTEPKAIDTVRPPVAGFGISLESGKSNLV